MDRWLLILLLSLSLQVAANDHKYLFDTPQTGLIKFLNHGKRGILLRLAVCTVSLRKRWN